MTFQPLDPLGQAMAAYRERGRHDIDWSGHPLMALYTRSIRFHQLQTAEVRRGKRAAAKGRKLRGAP